MYFPLQRGGLKFGHLVPLHTSLLTPKRLEDHFGLSLTLASWYIIHGTSNMARNFVLGSLHDPNAYHNEATCLFLVGCQS
jgi:hypothetical protein